MSSQQNEGGRDEQPVPQYSLNLGTMNENVRDMVYAVPSSRPCAPLDASDADAPCTIQRTRVQVRGAVPIAAGKIAAELTKPNHGYPFDEIL